MSTDVLSYFLSSLPHPFSLLQSSYGGSTVMRTAVDQSYYNNYQVGVNVIVVELGCGCG